MSMYATVATEIRDKDALVEALKALQPGWKVEVYAKAMPLYGYRGDQRIQVAEVIVRRASVGSVSNDIGFKLQADGTYAAIISDFDRNSMHYDEAWLGKLKQRYAVSVTKKYQISKGYKLVSEKVREDGCVELEVEL
jgi:hypothetical protein